MLKKTIRNVLSRNANNYRGWRIKRKIVVIESDDWGSICMPSQEVFKQLVNDGYEVDRNPYTSFDSLASEEDLSKLLSTLKEFKNSKGEYPVITANTIVANPDFDKIRDSNFIRYEYEPFTTTLKKYPESTHRKAFDLWKEGINSGIFVPQFHGREHIHVKAWMKVLVKAENPYKKVFNLGVAYLGNSYNGEDGSFRASFEADRVTDFTVHKQILINGLKLFESIFGFQSKSFIAPNYIYHPDLNKTLSEEGVDFIQGMKYQKLPLLGKEKHEMIRHTQGEKNELGQTYLVRNCAFEPSLHPQNHDNVRECLKDIQNAFLWGRPAVITSHRLNFIGHIDPKNRERNLAQFRMLLSQIIEQWPDVEFMNSVELGKLMASE